MEKTNFEYAAVGAYITAVMDCSPYGTKIYKYRNDSGRLVTALYSKYPNSPAPLVEFITLAGQSFKQANPVNNSSPNKYISSYSDVIDEACFEDLLDTYRILSIRLGNPNPDCRVVFAVPYGNKVFYYRLFIKDTPDEYDDHPMNKKDIAMIKQHVELCNSIYENYCKDNYPEEGITLYHTIIHNSNTDTYTDSFKFYVPKLYAAIELQKMSLELDLNY